MNKQAVKQVIADLVRSNIANYGPNPDVESLLFDYWDGRDEYAIEEDAKSGITKEDYRAWISDAINAA